jgi:chromosome partitioning protein
VNPSSPTSPAEIQLLGTAEIAELLGVTKQAVSNWRSRDEAFPSPVADLRSGPVWSRKEIVVWAQAKGLEFMSAVRAPKQQNKDACVVSVVNAKGGVGKSTISANLGWFCYSRLHKRVLLVDLDPQFNLSQYTLGIDEYEKLVRTDQPTVTSIFQAGSSSDARDKIQNKTLIRSVRAHKGTGARLDLLPSDLKLSGEIRNPYSKDDALHNFLRHAVGKQNYDLILIDCPPTDSMLTDAAYNASDYLLIPVRPEFLSAIGLALISQSITNFRIRKPDSLLDVAGVVLNGVINTKAEYKRAKTDILQAMKELHWKLFKTELSQSDSYPKGSRLGRPIFLTDYARWEKISEFQQFATEFAERVSL